MKYERLTMRNKGFIDTNCKNCKQCKKVGRKYICNDMTSCDEEIIERLAELEDKIERGELVDVKENHLIVISRTSGKSFKRLETIEILTKYKNGTLIEMPRMLTYVDYCYGLEKYVVEWIDNGRVKSRTYWNQGKAEAKLKELEE